MNLDLAKGWHSLFSMPPCAPPPSILAMIKNSSEKVDWSTVAYQDCLSRRLIAAMVQTDGDWAEVWAEVVKDGLTMAAWSEVLDEVMSLQNVNKDIRKIIFQSLPDEVVQSFTDSAKKVYIHRAIETTDSFVLDFLINKCKEDPSSLYDNCRVDGASMSNWQIKRKQHSLLAGCRSEECAKVLLDAGASASAIHNGKSVIDFLKYRNANTFDGEKSRKGIWTLVSKKLLSGETAEDRLKTEQKMFFDGIISAKTLSELKHVLRLVDKSLVSGWKTKNGWNATHIMAYRNPKFLEDLMKICKLDKGLLVEPDSLGKTAWHCLMMSPRFTASASDLFPSEIINKSEVLTKEFWASLIDYSFAIMNWGELSGAQAPFAALAKLNTRYEKEDDFTNPSTSFQNLMRNISIPKVYNFKPLRTRGEVKEDIERDEFNFKVKLLSSELMALDSMVTMTQQNGFMGLAGRHAKLSFTGGISTIAPWVYQKSKKEVGVGDVQEVRTVIASIEKYAACYIRGLCSPDSYGYSVAIKDRAKSEIDLVDVFSAVRNFVWSDVMNLLNGDDGENWKKLLNISTSNKETENSILASLTRLGESAELKKAVGEMGVYKVGNGRAAL